MTEHRALLALREMNQIRRKHRARVARVLADYLSARMLLDEHCKGTSCEAPPDRIVALCSMTQLRLMRAQEASRGSRIRARQAHEAWDAARAAAAQPIDLPPGLSREDFHAGLVDVVMFGEARFEGVADGSVRRVPPERWDERPVDLVTGVER